MTDEIGSIISHTNHGAHEACVRTTEHLAFGVTTDGFLTIQLGEGANTMAVLLNSSAARQIAAQLEAMANEVDGKMAQ